MFDCPNCGEPLRENASFCRHCGSDPETGWNPDVDYYSLELPGDDEDLDHGLPADVGDPRDPGGGWAPANAGRALVLLALFVLGIAGSFFYSLRIVPAVLFLVTMTWLFLRNSHGDGRR
jgi:hypothetical protein